MYHRDGFYAENSTQWKSINSFAARVRNTHIPIWTNFTFWAMGDALEEPPLKREAMSVGFGSLQNELFEADGLVGDRGHGEGGRVSEDGSVAGN
ncbi:hypothetical protein F4809DRAFT_627677 [Biscogniauxia mediterranea]|nr:hypothetical protein F4809DRAFT_627677 [Biscogniauxia mediterranea]